MAHLYDADYDQIHLLPPALEDWVPADHPARFVREFVAVARQAGDLALEWAPGEGGRPAYAADLLLRVWLYGYYEGVRSPRAVERACRDRLPFVWLAGTHTPDHNTLWRFFRQNQKAITGLFRRTLRVALEAGCVGFVLHAVDGTRIPAASATRSGWHRAALEERLHKLDAAIAALEADIAAAGEAGETPADTLPAALAETRQLRAAVQAAHDALRLEGLEHLHPQEPEARIQKCPDRGKKLFGYNAQAVADDDSGLIVAQDVVPDENDQAQLAPMLAQVQENLGQTAELTAADKGYANGEALQAAQAQGLRACVSLPEPLAGKPEEPYHGARFTYDAATDTMVCPEGRALPYLKDRHHAAKGYTVRVFRCPHPDCPARARCTKNKAGREIELAPFHAAVDEQRALAATEVGTRARRRRKHIIEPVFGQIKELFRFRRWTARGLDDVRVQWSLVCTAYNLKKLFARWRAGTLRLGAGPTAPPPGPPAASTAPRPAPAAVAA